MGYDFLPTVLSVKGGATIKPSAKATNSFGFYPNINSILTIGIKL
jgi:hypothetical protein